VRDLKNNSSRLEEASKNPPLLGRRYGGDGAVLQGVGPYPEEKEINARGRQKASGRGEKGAIFSNKREDWEPSRH